MVNHYDFYCVDDDFGPFFIKFCSYFPYDAKLCINGHEYAKRQLEKRGIKYEPLDNGILSCEDPQALQLIFDKRIPRTTKTRFRPRLITSQVIPSLWLDYKHSSIKPYFKMGRALRTELTVNHTRDKDQRHLSEVE